jgi:hypothetical protein
MYTDDNEELYKELGIDRDTYLNIQLEWARQYYRAWPWHINARRHSYMIATERAIYVERKLRGEHSKHYTGYVERLGRLDDWDRNEILVHDQWACGRLVRMKDDLMNQHSRIMGFIFIIIHMRVIKLVRLKTFNGEWRNIIAARRRQSCYM